MDCEVSKLGEWTSNAGAFQYKFAQRNACWQKRIQICSWNYSGLFNNMSTHAFYCCKKGNIHC